MMKKILMMLLAFVLWILGLLWDVIKFVFDALLMALYIGLVMICIFFIGVFICWLFGLIIF